MVRPTLVTDDTGGSSIVSFPYRIGRRNKTDDDYRQTDRQTDNATNLWEIPGGALRKAHNKTPGYFNWSVSFLHFQHHDFTEYRDESAGREPTVHGMAAVADQGHSSLALFTRRSLAIWLRGRECLKNCHVLLPSWRNIAQSQIINGASKMAPTNFVNISALTWNFFYKKVSWSSPYAYTIPIYILQYCTASIIGTLSRFFSK